MTERDKMLAGELYNPLDADLVLARERARDLCQTLNQARESEQELRRGLLSDLFGAGGDTVWMQPPFYCDYGSNIYLGLRGWSRLELVLETSDPRSAMNPRSVLELVTPRILLVCHVQRL